MSILRSFIFSYYMTLMLLALLGVGAGVATFIENDFGTSTARVLVYNNLWYELVLFLTCVNLTGIIIKTKMYKKPPKFLFHIAFVIIALGALVTRYFGYEGIMHIREGQTQNQMISLEPYLIANIEYNGKHYYQEYPLELSALGNNFNYEILFEDKKLTLKYVNYLFAKQGNATMGILTLNASIGDTSKEVKLVGKRGMNGVVKSEEFGDVKVDLEYGSKLLTLPFAIKLRDFELQRYPGSMSPSSYASEVTVIEQDGKNYDYRIFMNNTLHEGNFLFFQSSYDQDELGTVLSVNNDPGKWPTYLGYFLLTLGLIWNLFDKKSRYWQQINYLKKQNLASFILALSLASTYNAYADDNTTNVEVNASVNTQNQTAQVSDENAMIVKYFDSLGNDSKQVATNFGRLIVQDPMGRMKPVDSLNLEIVNKLSGKSSMFGLNSNQIVLGMLTRPEVWRNIKIVKITTPKLKKILGIDEKENYIAFSEVFKNGEYILTDYINEASRSKPQDRGTFEKDILKVDERLNIAFMVFNANLFKIFPQADDGHGHNDNNRWYTPLETFESFHGDNKVAVEGMIRGFINSVVEEKWNDADEFIKYISMYQHKVGESVIPDENIIKSEIMFNKIDIFPKLTIAYVLVGFILFAVAFLTVFSPKLQSRKINMLFFTVLAILFLIHTFGMGFRWYISGHAPWSDTYESLLYISWSAMFAGVVFFRKSLLALSATVIVAGIFMFTAHLSHIDPQITNLVPVLKSYWLTIHVSVLTGSYGFLGLGAILGFMSLLLFIFRNKNTTHIDNTIKQITAINEVALIIGLSAITIGNFLGAIWANESWGRYWGWDPKETWAYVAIVAYTIVLHLRFMKPLNNPFAFNVASLLAFSTILMTYFGVNFYLSGMHSYATGDPVPIPTWVYVTTALVFALIALAYKNRNLKDNLLDETKR